eukprot:NODE_26_length_35450_cov_0.398320.p12 type:complete len:252 gc:universal NODE_26_length_35450_cov_0.398320:34591-35346(+)
MFYLIKISNSINISYPTQGIQGEIMESCNLQNLPKQCSLPTECEFKFSGNLKLLVDQVSECNRCKNDYISVLTCLGSNSTMYKDCQLSWDLKCSRIDNENCYANTLSHLNRRYNDTDQINFDLLNNTNPGFECNECTRQFITMSNLMKSIDSASNQVVKDHCGSGFLDDVRILALDPYKWELLYLIGGFMSFFLIIIICIFVYKYKKGPESFKPLSEKEPSTVRRISLFSSPISDLNLNGPNEAQSKSVTF